MKVCPLTRIFSPAPEIGPKVLLTGDVSVHGKSIPVPSWPNRTHSHFGSQHPSGILGIFDRSGV